MSEMLEQAESYRRFAHGKSICHYRLSQKGKNIDTWLGFFATLFSSIVGALVFANFDKKVNGVIGGLSVAAGVLSALVTFFQFSKSSQHHKNAAAAYEEVRRKLDIYLLTNLKKEPDENTLVELVHLSSKLSKIAAIAPTVPDCVWDKNKHRFKIPAIFKGSSKTV